MKERDLPPWVATFAATNGDGFTFGCHCNPYLAAAALSARSVKVPVSERR